MTAPGRFCCCNANGGGFFPSCSDLYSDGILPATFTVTIAFDIGYGEPIPFTSNRREVFYDGTYSVDVDHQSCSSGGCNWSNNVGYGNMSGTVNVRIKVYNSSDVLISDDSASASIPSDFGAIAPVGVLDCITGSDPVPTRWDHGYDPILSNGLAGSGGNTVFAALVGASFIRNMPTNYLPQDVNQL